MIQESIMPLTIQEVAIEQIKPYENNPRINDQAVNTVADSIKEFGWRQPIVVDPNFVVICGHTRLKAAQKLGLTMIPVHVADLDPQRVKALRIADNQSATLAEWDNLLLGIEISHLQEMNYDLSHLGFDEDKLIELLASANQDDGNDADVLPSKIPSVKPEALQVIADCDRVVVQFSGGKDSTVALNWARGVCAQFKKPVTALFVDNGAEFLDLVSHVIRICEKVGVELTLLHPKQNILQYYYQKKMWPDSIYRDCLHKFINEPVNHYIRQFENERVICVRGGRSDQKTSLSKSDMIQDVKDGERVVHLLNPFFGVSKEDYEKALAEVKPLLWKGYEKGFVRTACYLCPFQKAEQWEALKIHYPLLWEEMRKLTQVLEYKEYKGDSTRRRFLDYWRKQTEQQEQA